MIKAPSALKEAHQWFAATMQLRTRGLTNLKPSLMNALEVQDIEVSSDSGHARLQLLMLSDVAYQEFFVERATDGAHREEDLRASPCPPPYSSRTPRWPPRPRSRMC